MPQLNYLGFHRKRWALSQRELSALAGHSSRSVVSRLELGHATPSLRFALTCQTIFGVGVDVLFPDFYEEHQDRIMRSAAAFDRALAGRTDANAERQQELLADMVRRAANHTPA